MLHMHMHMHMCMHMWGGAQWHAFRMLYVHKALGSSPAVDCPARAAQAKKRGRPSPTPRSLLACAPSPSRACAPPPARKPCLYAPGSSACALAFE